MTDTPSTILLLRLQSVGSNVNTWGGFLSVALQMIEQASKGYQALAVTGDATISWTNYVTGNSGECAALKLTGALSASASLTFPSLMNFLAVWNNAGASVTIKCSGGTGVTLANGDRALIYCDGVDYFNIGPNNLPGNLTVAGALTVSGQIHGVATGSLGTDAVNVTQLAAAIAASVPLGTAGTLLNSVTDTTRDFLSGKLTSTLGGITTTQLSGLTTIQLSTVHGGGVEQTLISLGAGYVGGFLNGGTKTAKFTPLQGTGYDVDCTSAGVTVNLAGMTNVMLGQEIKLNKFGNFAMFMLGTVNGITNLPITSTANETYRNGGATWGWN